MLYEIIAAIIVGLTLGLLGAGGAVIALPTFLYLLNFAEKHAVVATLVVVFVISFVNVVFFRQCDRGMIKKVLLFLIPGIGSSYLGALLGSQVNPKIQLFAFATLAMFAAMSMLLNPARRCAPYQSNNQQVVVILIAAVIVGFVTGFIGVGGGFLIVPAFMLLLGLNFLQAAAASVMLIMFQSATALLSYFMNANHVFITLDWPTVSLVAGVGAISSLLGTYGAKYVDQHFLTKLFAAALILMSTTITLLNV